MLKSSRIDEISLWVETKYRILTYAFLIISIVELILLLLSVSVKIYGINLSSSITNLEGLSTLITAIIVLFTLFEMQRQRKTTYQPQIVIADGSTIINYPDKSDPLIFEWTSKEIEIDKIKDFENIFDYPHYYYPKIKAFNIGEGFARKINIRWLVDFDYLQNALNDLSNKKHLDFTIQSDKNGFVCSRNGTEFCSFVSGADDICLEYILPIRIKEEVAEIDLPSGFCDMYAMFIQFMGYTPRLTPNCYYFAPPLIKIIITYLDIGNNKYSKKYHLKFFPGSGYVRDDVNSECEGYAKRVKIYHKVKEFG